MFGEELSDCREMRKIYWISLRPFPVIRCEEFSLYRREIGAVILSPAVEAVIFFLEFHALRKRKAFRVISTQPRQ